MKKIFSIVLAAALMLIGTQAFAQMSVNAGYLMSTETIKGSNPVNSAGAYAGVTYNIQIAGGFGIAPGVYYSMITNGKASSLNFLNIVTVSGSQRFTEHAINVPVYLNWGANLARDTKFFVYAGPTAQYGLVSKTRYDNNGSISYKNWYENPSYTRFNIYAGGGIGLQVARIQIALGYDYGLMNLDKSGNTNCHRSNLKLGVGFVF